MALALEIFGFLDLSITDVLDVLRVALIIYFVFRWIRHSQALGIFIAVILFYVIMVVVEALNMKLMSALFSTFIDVGVIALIVIFQPEIRHFLMKIGNDSSSKGIGFVRKLFGIKEEKSLNNESVNEITEACRSMAGEKCGALIVIPHRTDLGYVIETGDRIDADINRRLIMNLFFKNSPLHDGAVVMVKDRIVAARCTLPITERTDIPANFGMRHKAAIGITEVSDADVIVVSEQTGSIHYVHAGILTRINNINELKLLLGASLSQDRQTSQTEASGQEARPQTDGNKGQDEKN